MIETNTSVIKYTSPLLGVVANKEFIDEIF
jgi:hypothetical protein